MVGRQLPFFSVLVPFWLVAAFAGWRGMVGIWPAILVAGVPFAALQFLVSNLHGPWLVDVVASIASMAALVLFLRVWRPRDGWHPGARIGMRIDERRGHAAARRGHPRVDAVDHPERASCSPGGCRPVKGALDAWTTVRLPVPGLHNLVLRVPPVVPAPATESRRLRAVVGCPRPAPASSSRRSSQGW